MLTNHVRICKPIEKDIIIYTFSYLFVVTFHFLKWSPFYKFNFSQFSRLWCCNNVVVLYLMCVLLVVIQFSATLESIIVKFNATVFSQENSKYMRDEPTITNAFSIVKINQHPISLCLTRSQDFCLAISRTLLTQLTQHDCLLSPHQPKKNRQIQKLI